MSYKKVVVKAITRDNTTEVGGYTLYLFQKRTFFILPVKIDESSAHTLLVAQQSKPGLSPCIHDSLNMVVKAFRGRVVGGFIHTYENGIYNSSIRIKRKKRFVDVKTRLTDVVATTIRTNKPLHIEEDLLKNKGILVTKELLSNC